jgi:hypothetical protein
VIAGGYCDAPCTSVTMGSLTSGDTYSAIVRAVTDAGGAVAESGAATVPGSGMDASDACMSCKTMTPPGFDPVMPNDAGQDCTSAAEQQGQCLPFAVIDGGNEDTAVAAVAQAVDAGDITAAQNFVTAQDSYFTSAERDQLAQAMDDLSTRSSHDVANELQNGDDGYLPADDGVDPNSEVEPDSPESDRRATHGNVRAVFQYEWQAFGGLPNYIRWGVWRNGQITWRGYERTDMDAVVSGSPVYYGIDYAHYFRYSSGVRVDLANMTARLYRDITGPDTYQQAIGCDNNRQSSYCAMETAKGTSVTHWYYVETKVDFLPWNDDPTVHVKVQTRRYYVHSSSDSYFPAYYNGG